LIFFAREAIGACSEGDGEGGHEGAAALEMGEILGIRAADIMIGIEEVLAVERKLQMLTVTVLQAEVEEQLGIEIIVLRLSRHIVEFAA
jgi:hypothetical protein